MTFTFESFEFKEDPLKEAQMCSIITKHQKIINISMKTSRIIKTKRNHLLMTQKIPYIILSTVTQDRLWVQKINTTPAWPRHMFISLPFIEYLARL